MTAAIDVSADGVAITDAEGHYIYMNPTHASMFGYASVEDCLGLHWNTFYSEAVLRIFERDVFPSFSRDGYWRGEATGLAKDGSPVHQSLSLTALADGGILCTTRDIAIAKRREAQREQMQQMLADAERRDALGRMASSVAHDFANILAAINTSASLLGERVSDPALMDMVNRIGSSCRQANAIVEDLMHFDSEPVREACVIDDIVADVVDVMQHQFSDGRVLELLPGPDHLVCETDPTLFARLVANLVKNALEAIGGDGRVCVEVQRLAADQTVSLPYQPAASVEKGALDRWPVMRLIVSDDGSGMTQESLDNAFLPFQSTKGRSRGLGLVTIDALLAGQDGRVSVFSRPGAGSHFCIDLPLQEAQQSSRPATARQDQPVTSAAGAIVVDDDPEQVSFISAVLKENGWNTVEFTNPVDAMKVYRAAPRAFGLLITDRRMPEMSGDDLVKAIRHLNTGTRIIMCSGALQRPLPDGLAGTLAKPALAVDIARMAGRPFDGIVKQDRSGNSE